MKPDIIKKLPKSNRSTDFIRIGALALIISAALIAAVTLISALKNTLAS